MTYSLLDDLQTLEDSQQNLDVQLQAGKPNIITAWISYAKGRQYTIADKILKIYLHEDIESMGITGWLEMLDPVNIVRNGPIVGQELLYLQFETDGASEAGLKDFSVNYTKQPLAIYRVDGVEELKTASGGTAPQALTYRLHFCSPELLRNVRIRICQTIEGSYSDILKQILKNHLKTTKTIELQETTDLKHLNIPEMHPFEAISWITSNSEINNPSNSTSNPFNGRAADFYFYETTRGYKFLPAMHEPKKEITLTLGNAPITQSYFGQMTTATTYEYQAFADTLETIPSGLWGSKNIVHDAFNKSIKRYQSSYHKALKKEQSSWVNKTPVFNPTNTADKNRKSEDRTISDFPDSHLMLNSFSGKKYSTINKTSKEINYPWSVTPADLSMRRQMQIHHACSYNLLTARFHGISGLEVGMLVKLKLPDIGVASGQYDGGDYIFPNRLNNWWIIKQLTHVIDNSLGDDNTYHCDVILSNTLRATPKKATLPSYPEGQGSDQERFKPPAEPIFNTF